MGAGLGNCAAEGERERKRLPDRSLKGVTNCSNKTSVNKNAMLCCEPIRINHEQPDVTICEWYKYIQDAIKVYHFLNKVFFLNQWIVPEKFNPYPSHENCTLESYFSF